MGLIGTKCIRIFTFMVTIPLFFFSLHSSKLKPLRSEISVHLIYTHSFAVSNVVNFHEEKRKSSGLDGLRYFSIGNFFHCFDDL